MASLTGLYSMVPSKTEQILHLLGVAGAILIGIGVIVFGNGIYLLFMQGGNDIWQFEYIGIFLIIVGVVVIKVRPEIRHVMGLPA